MPKCSCCGKEVEKLTKGMCRKHYRQYSKYGKVLDNNPRTRNDLNEIILCDTHAEIILYDKSGNEKGRSLIDLDDVDKVKKYKWTLLDIKDSEGYCYNRKECLLLHRLVMNCPEDMVVDHIYHNTLDNRKRKLRTCTNSQNIMNKGIQSNNKSGFPGIDYYNRLNKWRARIKINNKTKCLGYFDNLEDAINVRKQAEKRYFGEYRYSCSNQEVLIEQGRVNS